MRASGVPLIDRALGGLAPALPVVLTGPGGAGRTLLCLQLAAAYTARGEVVVFVTEEPPALLLRQAASLSLDLEAPVGDGRLILLELESQAGTLVRTFGAEALMEAIETEAPRARLLLIDPVTALTNELVGESKQRSAVHALFEASAARDQTCVVTAESERLQAEPTLQHALESLCGVLVALERTVTGRRRLVVTKSRVAVPAQEPIEYEISSRGPVPVEGRTPTQEVREDAGGSPAPKPDPPREAPEVPRPAPSRDAPPARAENARAKVLVVEDERVTREMLAEWLEPSYDVVCAEDGFEAVSKVLSEHPDVIVLDLVMPRISGFEVIRALRSSGAAMPILVVSGYLARSGDRVRVLVLGATDMLAKPVQRFELLRKVETLLRLPHDAGPDLDPQDVDQLLFTKSSTRTLPEAEFRDRLERACRFGSTYGLASSLVLVETPSAESLDALVAVTDRTLRLEDAVLPLPKRRAVLLLVATDTSGVRPALERVGRQLREDGTETREIRWRAMPAELEVSEDWSAGFQELKPWPPGGKS